MRIKTPANESQLPAESPGPPHDLPQSLLPLVNAILPQPDRVERLIGLARVVKQQGKPKWVVPLIRHAQFCAEADGRGQEALRRFWNLPAWHSCTANCTSGCSARMRARVSMSDIGIVMSPVTIAEWAGQDGGFAMPLGGSSRL